MSKNDFSQKKIIIVYHEVLPIGPAHDLRDYLLRKKVKKLVFISHPLLYNKIAYKSSSKYEKYSDGKKIEIIPGFHWRLPDIFLYIKDVIYTVGWAKKGNAVYDLYIGFNPLNAFAGIVLKKMKLCNRVVYYSIDYFTKRFENKLMNGLYHWVDRYCVKNADETWNISPSMKKSREDFAGLTSKEYSRQYTVPVAIDAYRASIKHLTKSNQYKLIFSGYLVPILGVDLVVESIPSILKKIPQIKLEIIGGGPQEEELKNLVYKLNIEDKVFFHGWVKDREKLHSLLENAAIGVASFNTKILNDEIKNADPAKIKDYMLAGLPVIATNAFFYAKEMQQEKAGIIIDYSIESLSKAVIDLLRNKELLTTYRKNSHKFIKKFDFSMIYEPRFNSLFS